MTVLELSSCPSRPPRPQNPPAVGFSPSGGGISPSGGGISLLLVVQPQPPKSSLTPFLLRCTSHPSANRARLPLKQSHSSLVIAVTASQAQALAQNKLLSSCLISLVLQRLLLSGPIGTTVARAPLGKQITSSSPRPPVPLCLARSKSQRPRRGRSPAVLGSSWTVFQKFHLFLNVLFFYLYGSQRYRVSCTRLSIRLASSPRLKSLGFWALLLGVST